GVVLLRAADDLPVQRVLHLALDPHGHGLVGLVGDDGPDQDAFRHRLTPQASAEARERSVCSALMRAISRRASLIRAERAGWLVAPCKRTFNCSRFDSTSCSASWSSVLVFRSSNFFWAIIRLPGARCRRGGRRPWS